MSDLSALHVFHPGSTEEAHTLLATSVMPVDSPTQRRIRSADNLSEYLAAGRRRPAWVWAIRRGDDPTPLGVVGAFGAHGVFLLDLFGVPAEELAARELIARATADALADHDEVEVTLFAPPGTTLGDAAIASTVAPLTYAGWRLLVERRHYEFEPPPGLGGAVGTDLRVERLSDPADPRLVACHREVMRDTLDAHDGELIDRLGFERACVQSLQDLLEADPVDRLHLALDGEDRVVGLVSGVVHPNTRGVVSFVGVARDHRGHGYGRQLLAWQTRRLLEAGARTLIADTDNDNVPMARAFADVGWEQTETRIDLVHGG